MITRDECTGCLGYQGPPCGCGCHSEDDLRVPHDSEGPYADLDDPEAYRYHLTATLGDEIDTYDFNEPDPDFGPDVEAWRHLGATATAIREVMNRAYADREGPWALGKIVLTDTLTGEVMREMEAK